MDSLPKFSAHILAVEDDRTSQHMIKGILNEVGCTVDIASDGTEAIALLKENAGAYDLIFMDCQMPGMDGFETTGRIRAQEWGKGMKIISLTANALQGDREKCLRAGADDYVSKPVRLQHIIKILQKHCIPTSPKIDRSNKEAAA